MIKKYLEKLINRNPALYWFVIWIFSRKILANNPLYKKLVFIKAKKTDEKHGNEIPKIYIETTLNCNAKCIMCAHAYKKMNGLMSMELYEKIIDDCKTNKIKDVALTVYGEALVDPYFINRVEYLREAGLRYSFFTNGYLLKKELSEKIIELGSITSVNFSVNALTKQCYDTVMVGLERETTYKNILEFLKLKNGTNNNIKVSISCIKTKMVEKELDDFIKYWKNQKGVDEIYVWGLYDRFGDGSVNKNEIGEKYCLNSYDLWMSPCRELWTAIYILYDGRVLPCCINQIDRDLVIGDLNSGSIQDVLSGDIYLNLRKAHLENRRKDHPICGRCGMYTVWHK